ncbi:MAG: hypothetical protein SH856_06105, partial [Flavobacteriales bacterium]|nr:hypothetical protein [Flavobacteriales bacterium]
MLVPQHWLLGYTFPKKFLTTLMHIAVALGQPMHTSRATYADFQGNLCIGWRQSMHNHEGKYASLSSLFPKPGARI